MLKVFKKINIVAVGGAILLKNSISDFFKKMKKKPKPMAKKMKKALSEVVEESKDQLDNGVDKAFEVTGLKEKKRRRKK